MAPPLGSNLLVRLPAEMHDQLRAVSVRRGSSASELVRAAIAEIIDSENEETSRLADRDVLDDQSLPAKAS